MAITNKRDGFSLIEVALGLLIIGLLMGPLMAQYTAYINDQQYQNTKDNAGVSIDALTKYVLNYGCYPVPAPPGVPSSNAAAGVEGVVRTTCTALTAGQLAAIPPCAGSDAGVCQEPAAVGVAGAGPILVGDVPYNTLGLPKKYVLDGFNHKFTYAVSANLVIDSTSGPFDNSKGAVKVVDLFGKGPTPNNGSPPGNGPPVLDAHYVIVSHGKDGGGSFTLDNNGTAVAACAGGGKDVENCLYNDGTFDDGFAPYNASSYGNTASLQKYDRQETRVAGASHYDDYVYYRETLSTDIWAKQASTSDILSNNSTGNVLVETPNTTSGPTAPQAKLDIRGDLTADSVWTNIMCDTSGNTYAAGAYTNKPCSTAGGFYPLAFGRPLTPAMKVQAVADSVIHCNLVSGSTSAIPMTGIAAGDEVCDTSGTQTLIKNTDPVYNVAACAAGTYPDGFVGGILHCRAPP